MKKLSFTLFIILCFTSFSFSQTGETELHAEYKKVDKELNTIYNKLKNKLGAEDKKALVEAQKAWILFRDLNCKFKSQEESEGGVIANKMKIGCLIDTTIERTNELKNLIEGF